MKNKKNILTTTIIILIIIAIIVIYTLDNQNKTKYGLQKISYEEIIEKQENKEDFILIVSRTDCAHCADYKPKVNELAKNHDIIVYYIDTDTLSNKKEFLTEFNLSSSTPMTLFFKDGKETTILNRLEGDKSTLTIKEKFKEMGFID